MPLLTGVVGKWPKAAIVGLPKVFAGKDTTSANQKAIRALHAKIEQLLIGKDFLLPFLHQCTTIS